MSEKSIIIREAVEQDLSSIMSLYKSVSKITGGLARTENEITDSYIQSNFKRAQANGFSLVAEDISLKIIVGEVHCYKLEPIVFDHMLSELTVVVHPDYQGIGIGKELFQSLLSKIEKERPDVLRVELIARESNVKAIRFYQSIGFVIEGKFNKRIKNHDGSFEADIPMAWINKNYKQS